MFGWLIHGHLNMSVLVPQPVPGAAVVLAA
jgi:hypothetical protein